jgi:hypothetical protein
MLLSTSRRYTMPHSTIVVVVGLIVAFGALALSLAWADLRTRDL